MLLNSEPIYDTLKRQMLEQQARAEQAANPDALVSALKPGSSR